MYIKTDIGMRNAQEHIALGNIVYTTDKDRTVGKTRTIMALAILTNKPIIVGSKNAKKLYDNQLAGFGVKVHVAGEESLRGLRLPNGVLVDEVSESQYEGFKYLLVDTEISGFVYVGGKE